jgi:5-methyltetrahydrofolate--homocysteine methyltransferase
MADDHTDNKNPLPELLRERGVMLFDAAMGSRLLELDLPSGVRSEAVNLRHPDVVIDIHRENIEAGSDIITANTFGISGLLAGQARDGDFALGLDVLRAGVECARAAADGAESGGGGRVLVALDIGPTGRLVELSDDLSHAEAVRLFAAQAEAGAAAGADLVLIETMTDLEELKDAVAAAKAACKLPVFCTMTFAQNGYTFMGVDPVSFAQAAEALGAAAVGVNCTLAPKEVFGIVQAMAGATDLPVIVQPNASQPLLREGKHEYTITPPVFAADAALLTEAGASLLGGCCGTTPAAIALLDGILTRSGKRYKTAKGYVSR